MATLKQRLHRKNATGYDVIHFETESSLVLRPSGRTVEQDLEDYLPKVQDNDTVPDTLKSGQLLTGQNIAFIGMTDEPERLITERDHPIIYEEDGEMPPFEGIDASTLEGHPASDFLLKSEYTPVDLSSYLQTSVADTKYAAKSHTHTPSSIGAAAASHTHTANQITGGTFAGSVMASTSGSTLTIPAIRNIYANTTDLTAGSSELGTGVVYLVYE